MSRIEELLRQLAPDGVKVELLGDFAQLVRGNGMPKSVLTTGGVGAIHYGQIYTRYGVSAESTISYVSPDTASKLTKVMPGDVIITNTSENFEDIGKAVAWLGSDPIVTGGHATVIKHDEDSKYLAYWFQSRSFFKQKRGLASGTKVIDVSAKQLAKVRIPLPPREVQREIVRILEGFDSYVSSLSAALNQEDSVRRDEYSHYRDLLLTESQKDVEGWTPLGGIYDSSSGLSKSADQFGYGHPFLSFKTVFNNAVVPAELTNLVNSTEAEQTRFSIKAGDVFVTRTSEDLDGLGTSCAALRDYPTATFNGFTKRLRPKETSVVDAQFAAYFFRSSLFRSQISRMAILSTRVSLNNDILMRIRMPLPSIEEQRRIVATLEKLDALSSELSVQIKAEVTARRKQLAYYRDSLFEFEELAP